MKKPEMPFHYRGPIERLSLRSTRDPWREGYSANSESGTVLYPWNTKRECQTEAKAQGYKAVFYRNGKREA